MLGKEWDGAVPATRIWEETLRVLKPGAHLLVFGATRTWHRLACNIEDAGFEIVDTLGWFYGSGFPKSRDIGKVLPGWSGYGTALKTAWEPVLLARKPADRTHADNAATWGVAGLNLRGCAIPCSEKSKFPEGDYGDRGMFGGASYRSADADPGSRFALAGIGIGGRGDYDLGCFMKEPVVQFVAIADIRKDRREAVKRKTEAKYGPGVATYRDFREMLARQDINAVLIATGDRWHTPASIYAAKAGKDIYCEKPCSTTIVESQALADTMRRYGRIYQAGTQRRSLGNFIFATELCHSGKLGKLTAVHANTLYPGTGHDWLPGQPEPPKEEVDWDLWLGPAPWRPYNKTYIDGGWRGHFDFHGGGILEWGAHTVDLCNWAGTNDEKLPVLYEPTGVGVTTSNIWDGTTEAGCVATYADGLKLVMRSTGWMGLGGCAVRYEGEDGWVETGESGRLEFSSGRLRAEQKRYAEEGITATHHVRNFLECMKTRKPTLSNPEVVARSHIICHAAYIAWQLGRRCGLTRSRRSSSAMTRPIACGHGRFATPGGSERTDEQVEPRISVSDSGTAGGRRLPVRR